MYVMTKNTVDTGRTFGNFISPALAEDVQPVLRGSSEPPPLQESIGRWNETPGRGLCHPSTGQSRRWYPYPWVPLPSHRPSDKEIGESLHYLLEYAAPSESYYLGVQLLFHCERIVQNHTIYSVRGILRMGTESGCYDKISARNVPRVLKMNASDLR